MALAATLFTASAIIHHSPIRIIPAVLFAISAVMAYVSARKEQAKS